MGAISIYNCRMKLEKLWTYSQKQFFSSIDATITVPTVLHFKVNLISKTILEKLISTGKV